MIHIIGMVIGVHDVRHAHVQSRLHGGIKVLHGLLTGDELVDMLQK